MADSVAPQKVKTPIPFPPQSAAGFPVATLVISAVAGLIFCFPVMNGWFLYNRELILHGQVWRAWTGHIVHYSPSHFIWNLIIFIAAGCWLEMIRPKSTRWFYVACPAVISASLLVGEPSMERYAGLSGLASGVLIFLAFVQLSENNAEPTWLWVAVFGLVAVKIALETVTGAPLLVHDFAGFRVVPLAHISGAMCGLIAWAITRPPVKVEPTPAE